MKYARKLKPNSLLIYLQLLSNNADIEQKDLDYILVHTSRYDISQMTGIADNTLNPFLEELVDSGLLVPISKWDYIDEIEEVTGEYYDYDELEGLGLIGRHDLYYRLTETYKNCEGGFIEVPRDILNIREVPYDEGVIKIKPRHKLLWILHCILAENKGYSFANEKYLADTLGVTTKTIRNLHKQLKKAGLLKVTSFKKVLGHNHIHTENYYYPQINIITLSTNIKRETEINIDDELSDLVF